MMVEVHYFQPSAKAPASCSICGKPKLHLGHPLTVDEFAHLRASETPLGTIMFLTLLCCGIGVIVATYPMWLPIVGDLTFGAADILGTVLARIFTFKVIVVVLLYLIWVALSRGKK